jgi:hypothetical protein
MTPNVQIATAVELFSSFQTHAMQRIKQIRIERGLKKNWTTGPQSALRQFNSSLAHPLTRSSTLGPEISPEIKSNHKSNH